MTRILTAALAAIVLAACGSDSPTAPEIQQQRAPSLAGTYELAEVNGQALPHDAEARIYRGGAVVLRSNGSADFTVEYDAATGTGDYLDRRIAESGTWRAVDEGGYQIVIIEMAAGDPLVGQTMGRDALLFTLTGESFRFER